MYTALIPVVRVALAWVVKGIASNISDVRDALYTLGKIVDWLTEVIQDVFGAAKGAENYSEDWASDAGDSLAKIGDDLKAVTEHTYNTVIPHSMSWLAGYVMAHWIQPLRDEIATLAAAIRTTILRVDAIESWRTYYIDPEVHRWRAFKAWFDTWPTNVLNQWHEWFDKPHDFALWAAPPLIGPLVSYLAAPEHKQTRDNLLTIMMRSWEEEPEVVWRSIQGWLLK